MAEVKFSTNDRNQSPPMRPNLILIGIVTALVLIVVFNCFTIVSEGHIGVKYRLEKIISDDLTPGLNFKIPFIERIEEVEIRNLVYPWEGDAYTRDTQTVNELKLKVTYRYAQDQMTYLIRTIGVVNVETRILLPSVQKIAKDAIGRVNAEDLVRERSRVQNEIQEELARELEKDGIIVTAFAIENLAFTAEFASAVQAKVIAEQDVERMRHKTEERRVEAEQVRITAQAQADRIKTEAEAEAEAIKMIQEQIAQNYEYIEYLKIIEWDGILPQVIGEGVNPFVVLDGTGRAGTNSQNPTPAPPDNNENNPETE